MEEVILWVERNDFKFNKAALVFLENAGKITKRKTDESKCRRGAFTENTGLLLTFLAQPEAEDMRESGSGDNLGEPTNAPLQARAMP